MRHLLTFLSMFMMFNFTLNAQLNDYKYIIVPKKFDTFNSENQYQTSTLIKYLFVQKGFNTVYEGDFPEDLENDLCLGLRVSLDDKSTLFKTRTSLILKDCELKEVFRTHEGTSKSKDLKKTYNEAIRGAFTSFDIIDYVYKPKAKQKTNEPITVSFKNDVKKLEETDTNVTMQKATTEEQAFKSIEPKESEMVKAKSVDSNETPVDQLFAKRTATGYNLINSEDKIEFKLLDTSVDNIFLLDEEDRNGVVFLKEGKWYLESTEKGKKVQELKIKF